MSAELIPKPGAAPWSRRLTQHIAMELRLLSRQGEQLMLTIVIPLIVLFVGTKAGGILGTDRPLDVVFPGVLALAIVSMSFTSLAIATGFERRYGVLKHLGSTPLSPLGLLLGKALAIVVAQLIQGAIFFACALALGWRPHANTDWLAFAVTVFLGTLAFAGIGLLIAGSFRAEVTLALANLLFVLAVAFGGLVMPVERMSARIAPFIEYSPTGALGESMRGALAEGPANWSHLVALAIWALIAGFACIRWFRWE